MKFSLSSGYVVVPHCGFHLHSLFDLMLSIFSCAYFATPASSLTKYLSKSLPVFKYASFFENIIFFSLNYVLTNYLRQK